MAQFESSVVLPCSQEKVFEFLSRPANLVKLVPPTVGLAIVRAPELIELGSQLEFKLQAWGQVLNFLHEIITFESPNRISERQVKGLFGKWVQEHTLSTSPSGEAQIGVKVEFEPPPGLLGFLVTKNKILEYLEDGFDHRHEAMRKILAET